MKRRRSRQQKRTLRKRSDDPPFTIAAAVVGIASTAYSMATAGKQKKQQTTSTSEQVYPAETLNLFQSAEKPLLQGVQKEQYQLLPQLWGGTEEANAFAQQYGQGLQQNASAAVEHGAKTAGISDTGQAEMDIQGLPPTLLNALKALAMQNAGGRTTVVPPGYGNFLAPGQKSTSESKQNVDPFATGFQLAGSLTSLGSSVYKAT